MRHNLTSFIMLTVILLTASICLAIPAFPGAEGFGANAIGGRGGKVIFVTNLNNSGPGSLRQAVETKGPRTVVFKVSGTIALRKSLVVREPDITIAGQTAPGDGICLKDDDMVVAADNVIIRYLRCRPGDNLGREVDSLSISSGDNIIVDHCSASWSVDETLSASTGSDNLNNVTVQWCIIAESLNRSVHHKGPHGYGSLIRGGFGHAYSYHHNLYAHHRGRSPRPGNYNDSAKDPIGFLFDFRNNVIYNWAGADAGYNSDASNGVSSITKMNFIANYYQMGPNSTHPGAFSESTPSARAYFAENAMDGSVPKDPWSLVNFRGFSDEQIAAYKLARPLPVAAVTTQSAARAYELVLAHAGATRPKRDRVDAQVVEQVRTRTGKIIDDEEQAGSWPELKSAAPPADADNDAIADSWEKAHNLDPHDPSDAARITPTGYTNLELYLNDLADPPVTD